MPRGLKGRGPLFTVLRQALTLPEHFGGNWDALSDCLRDLSWITQRRVILVHQDVPGLEPEALTAYLEVLADAVASWTSNEPHELIVVFPAEAPMGLAA